MTFDLSRMPDLLARLDTIAACPQHVRDDLPAMHDACSEAAAAIRTLMQQRDSSAAAEREAVGTAAGDEAEIDGTLASFGYIGNENAMSRSKEIKDAIRFTCNKAVAAEREACAKVCDNRHAKRLGETGGIRHDACAWEAMQCAKVIRARGAA